MVFQTRGSPGSSGYRAAFLYRFRGFGQLEETNKDQDPTSPSAQSLLLRAQDLYRNGDLGQAEAVTRSLLDFPSARPDALFGLGMIQVKRGLTEEAKKNFTEALELAPNSADAHFQLARLLHETAPHEAEAHYRKALESRPKFPEARDGLSRLCTPPDRSPDLSEPQYPAGAGAEASTPQSAASGAEDNGRSPLTMAGAMIGIAVLSIAVWGLLAWVIDEFLPEMGDLGLFAPILMAVIVFLLGIGRLIRRSRLVEDPFIAMVESDRDPISAEIAKLLKSVVLDRRPALLAHPGSIFVLPAFVGGCVFFALITAPARLGGIRLPQASETEAILVAVVLAAGLSVIAILRILTTRITIRQGRVRLARGILLRQISYVELARVTDVTVHRGPWGLLTGYGTLTLTIGVQTPRNVQLSGIARGARLNNLAENIRQTSVALRASRWGRDVLVWR